MREIEKMLVYEISENFTKKQISDLIVKEETAKNILMYDFLSKDNLEIFNSKKSIFEKVLSGHYDGVSFNRNEYFKFKTPKKEILLREYKRNLSKETIRKADELKTKEELKKLYCLDEIFRKLNPNRKERLNSSADISLLIDSSIRSYKNQLVAQKIEEKIEEFSTKANKINYACISFEDIKYIESLSEEVIRNARKESSDFEIDEKIQKSKKVLDGSNTKIIEGINKRTTTEFEEYLEYFNNLNRKDFLSLEEVKNLKKNKEKLSDLENILNHFGDLRVSTIHPELIKYPVLISLNDYFYGHKEEFDSIMKRQRKINRRIKKVNLKEKPSAFEFIRINRIRNYLKKTEKNFASFAVFYENRYLKQKFDGEKEVLIEEFKSLEPEKNWSEKILNSKYYIEKFLLFDPIYKNHLKNKKDLKKKKLLEDIDFFKMRVEDKNLLI